MQVIQHSNGNVELFIPDGFAESGPTMDEQRVINFIEATTSKSVDWFFEPIFHRDLTKQRDRSLMFRMFEISYSHADNKQVMLDFQSLISIADVRQIAISGYLIHHSIEVRNQFWKLVTVKNVNQLFSKIVEEHSLFL